MNYLLHSYVILLSTFVICLSESVKEESQTSSSDAALKCDTCKVIAQRFANAFKTAEIEAGNRRLNEDEYIEAAESTCDEDWSGYGVITEGDAKRLVGRDTEIEAKGQVEFDQIWDRRLQDFCDELLAEAPDEKTLYNLWSSDSSSLEKYFCHGEGMMKACVPNEEFGPWPGDEYDDYDDMDFDYTHDEF